ncbi:uncharacterized protein JCM15063_002900 [Sporobolomyces koalae]|uniref:uncharacterized protein n=1 Tax=Sporobolomyces koalae TaxID=500713 RepID=UPI0031796FAF
MSAHHPSIHEVLKHVNQLADEWHKTRRLREHAPLFFSLQVADPLCCGKDLLDVTGASAAELTNIQHEAQGVLEQLIIGNSDTDAVTRVIERHLKYLSPQDKKTPGVAHVRAMQGFQKASLVQQGKVDEDQLPPVSYGGDPPYWALLKQKCHEWNAIVGSQCGSYLVKHLAELDEIEGFVGDLKYFEISHWSEDLKVMALSTSTVHMLQTARSLQKLVHSLERDNLLHPPPVIWQRMPTLVQSIHALHSDPNLQRFFFIGPPAKLIELEEEWRLTAQEVNLEDKKLDTISARAEDSGIADTIEGLEQHVAQELENSIHRHPPSIPATAQSEQHEDQVMADFVRRYANVLSDSIGRNLDNRKC